MHVYRQLLTHHQANREQQTHTRKRQGPDAKDRWPLGCQARSSHLISGHQMSCDTCTRQILNTVSKRTMVRWRVLLTFQEVFKEPSGRQHGHDSSDVAFEDSTSNYRLQAEESIRFDSVNDSEADDETKFQANGRSGSTERQTSRRKTIVLLTGPSTFSAPKAMPMLPSCEVCCSGLS